MSLAAEYSLGGWEGKLYQSDAATVRDDWYAEFLRHEQHRHDLVDAAQAAGINLADVNRARLEKLFENHCSSML
jgi:hypothetical protein